MSRFDISGNTTREPNLQPTQNALSSSTQVGASTFLENLVEPSAELASTDSSMNVLPPEQQAQSAHGLPAISQEKVMLLQELEAARQMLQHQQTLTELLTRQLVGSQERIAQMERDLALLQQHHDEQRYLLKNAEANCQNLRARLYRQQHQALQFKAALEKCSENPTLNAFDSVAVSEVSQNQPNHEQERYATTGSQPLQPSPTSHRSCQWVDFTPGELQQTGLYPLGCPSPSIGVESVSAAMTQLTPIHRVERGASLEEKAPSEDTTVMGSTQAAPTQKHRRPPLIFQGQPVQTWSAPSDTSSSTVLHQESTVHPASTIQVQIEAARSSQSKAASSQPSYSTPDSSRSSPLPEPLHPASRRKPVKIQLPTFPRRQP